MKKIVFICHGNICRSPMAEFVMKKLVKEAGRGNPIYPPAKAKMREHGIPFGEHRDVADPWYTGDFETTYRDIIAGCTALLKALS